MLNRELSEAFLDSESRAFGLGRSSFASRRSARYCTLPLHVALLYHRASPVAGKRVTVGSESEADGSVQSTWSVIRCCCRLALRFSEPPHVKRWFSPALAPIVRLSALGSKEMSLTTLLDEAYRPLPLIVVRSPGRQPK